MNKDQEAELIRDILALPDKDKALKFIQRLIVLQTLSGILDSR